MKLPSTATVGKSVADALGLKRRSKYGAKRTVYNGVLYASKAEASRAAELDFEVKAGAALWWIGQPVFRLGVPENVYRADFLVVSRDGVRVEDVKGMRTAKFNRDLKLWRAYGPCPLWVITADLEDCHIVEGKGR